MSKECKKVKILLPALIETEEQKEMTDRCRKSLVSFGHCARVYEDNKKYPTKVAGVWNAFLSKWVGKEYDYLMITANDTEADPMAIDFMVRCAEDNPRAGIISGHVERDYDKFKQGYGQQIYSGELTQGYSNMDPACFLIRKGVIEKVGLMDEQYPCEFVERNYIWRCKLAGYDWVEPKEVLWYHPPYAGTIGNDDERLQKALRKYVMETGGDAGKEVFRNPYNNLSLNYTFRLK